MQNYQSTTSSYQQSNNKNNTPSSQHPNQIYSSSQSIQQIVQSKLPPTYRMPNLSSQQNYSSQNSNRQAINQDSYQINRQISDRELFNLPQPQYKQTISNQSYENNEIYELSSQKVQTLPNYPSNRPTDETSQNYPPQIKNQQNLQAQSKKNQNTDPNIIQQLLYSRPLASPHNWHLANKQQNNNPPILRSASLNLKASVQEQLEEFKVELMKNFQNVVQECLQKNQISNNQIQNLKKQIGSSKQIKEVNQNMADSNLRIEDMRNQQYNEDINEEQIEREVQQIIKGLYEKKIDNIENEQNEIKLMLENLKDQLIREIGEQMNTIGSTIQTQVQEEDEIIYQNISDIKHQWEKKLNHVFEQMNNKINSIERNLENFKREKATPKIEIMQNEIYSKFDENVKKYESQLMNVKAQIDSKLDRTQLPEVIQGYKNIKESEIFNKISHDVENFQRQIKENASETEKNTIEYEDRIRKFEQFIESKLKDYNQKVQNKYENNNQIENQIQQQETMLLQFDEQISQLNQQYESFQQELKSYDTNAYELKNQSDDKFQKLVSDLNYLENTMSQNNSKIQKDLSLSHQFMDDKVENLNKEMQILLTQMSAFQNNLDENIQQFNQKISIEHQQHQKILDSIQQKQSISSSNQLSQQKINSSSSFQDAINQNIDVRDSQISTKYDDYLKKYEDFNKEVSSYLTKRDVDGDDNDNQKHSSSNLERRYQNQLNNFIQQQDIDIQITQQNIKINPEKNKRRGQQDKQNDEEVEEIVYELDEEGYLVDEKGISILDEEGKQIQLSKEQIEYLKTNDILQDD